MIISIKNCHIELRRKSNGVVFRCCRSDCSWKYYGWEECKRQNQQLDAWYQQAIQETPAEKEYREKLEKGKSLETQT